MKTTNTNTAAAALPPCITWIDAARIKDGAKIEFIDPSKKDKHFTRTVHNSRDLQEPAYIKYDHSNVILGGDYFSNYTIVSVDGMPLEQWRIDNGIAPAAPVAPAPVAPVAPAAAPVAPAAPAMAPAPVSAPAAVATAPEWLDQMTALSNLIKDFRACGNDAAAAALSDIAVTMALDERMQDRRDVAAMNAVTHAPKPAHNANKRGRVTAPAAPVPPSAPAASNLVTMPLWDSLNTIDSTLKNYVNPRVMLYLDEIEADALELAQAAGCNIRVYFRGTWVWFQAVNCDKGFGRSDTFKAAAAMLPHGYKYSRDELANLNAVERNRVMATEYYQYADKRGQVRRVLPLL